MLSSVLEIMLVGLTSKGVLLKSVLKISVIENKTAAPGKPIVMITRCISTAQEAQRRLV